MGSLTTLIKTLYHGCRNHLDIENYCRIFYSMLLLLSVVIKICKHRNHFLGLDRGSPVVSCSSSDRFLNSTFWEKCDNLEVGDSHCILCRIVEVSLYHKVFVLKFQWVLSIKRLVVNKSPYSFLFTMKSALWPLLQEFVLSLWTCISHCSSFT